MGTVIGIKAERLKSGLREGFADRGYHLSRGPMEDWFVGVLSLG